MNCLFCKEVFENEEILQQHYIDFHNLIQLIIFLKNCLNLKEVAFQQKKCLPCDEFLPTTEFKRIHNFLRNSQTCTLL